MHYWDDGGSGAGGWMMMGMMLLFIVVTVGLVVWLVRQFAVPNVPAATEPTASPASVILDERFARGEIDEDEYQQRRSVLNGQSTV